MKNANSLLPLKPFILSFFVLCTLAGMPLSSLAAPIAVTVEPVRRTFVQDHAEALGTLRANESVALTVNVTETITAIHFDDGQEVQANDVLAEMTSAEESALLLEAQTNIDEAKLQLDRVRHLATINNASQSLLDQRQRDYSAAKARLEGIRSRVKDRIVTAPFSGKLGLRNISLGALVRPGDLITTLTDSSTMKLDFSLPAVFLPNLTPGLALVATSSVYPDETFHGRVSSIDNQIDPITRAMIVRARLPNDQQKLKQGMLMQVDIQMNERLALLIPEEALMPQGRENYVMVISDHDGKTLADKRKVTIATRTVGAVEIIDGLVEGERVITHGAFKVSPGGEVIVQSPDLEKKRAMKYALPAANAALTRNRTL